MTFIVPIMYYLTVAVGYVGALLGVAAAIDAIMRRADAYPAADKQTKSTWLAITVLSATVLVLGAVSTSVISPPSLLWLAAMVGALVYLVDVRPRLKDVSSGGSSW